MPRRFLNTPRIASSESHAFGRIHCAMVIASACLSMGCQQWPGSSQARQFQQDSERILSEFRAEKQRADELAAKNQLLEQRLAETEKQYALQNLAGSRNRSGTRSSETRMSIGSPSGLNQLSQSNTSRSTHSNSSPAGAANGFPATGFTGPGLPDARPGTGSRLTSAANQGNRNNFSPNMSDAVENQTPNDPRTGDPRTGRPNIGVNPYAPQWRPIQK